MYSLLTTKKFDKNFKKIDRQDQIKLKNWIIANLEKCEDPRIQGKCVKGKLGEYWRYRVGNYRIIAQINDAELIIVAIDVGSRQGVYR